MSEPFPNHSTGLWHEGEWESFGPYQVFERLGIGGVATVHRAIHLDGREVALKRLLPQFHREPSLRDQFLQEANIARSLRHPNIVAVEDFGYVDGQCYLAMERVHGRSVLEVLKLSSKQRRGAPIDAAIWIVEEVLAGLDYAMYGVDDDGEEFRVVHRDLSPSNIILTPDGGLKLIDFGIAKSIDGRFATSSGRIKGKLGYMAPEIMRGLPVDARCDVFSLSVVMWELLSGKRMFQGAGNYSENGLSREHTSTQDDIAFPIALESFLAQGLCEDPAGRFSSVREMRRELREIVSALGLRPSHESALRWMHSLNDSQRFFPDIKTMVEPIGEEVTSVD